MGLLTMLVALIALLHSPLAAKSALLGGLTCALPNAYFIWRAFRYSGARSAAHVVQSFYQGESWKFVLTALCFGVIFQRVEPLKKKRTNRITTITQKAHTKLKARSKTRGNKIKTTPTKKRKGLNN